MELNFKQIFEQISKVLNKINKKQRIIIITTFVVLIGFLTYLILFQVETKNEYENYEVLFTNLAPEDSAAILQKLQQEKVPYKLPEDNLILVPKDKVYEQRIMLSSLGLPKKSKVGFEILLENNIGETSSTIKSKYLIAKQNELAKTIESLNPIEKAVVNISLPKESLFVQGGHPATASVSLYVRNNMLLSPEQVIGIKNLVAASIERLDPKDVKVIDQDGNLLGEDDEAALQGALARQAAFQRRFKQNAENAEVSKIVQMLKASVGSDGIVAQVTIDYDFSVRKSTQEEFGQNPVVRGTMEYQRERKGFRPPQIGGVPGVVSNIGPVQGLKDDEMMEWEKESKVVVNNEIDHKISEIKEHYGVVRRVSASVMVDGTYKEVIDEDGEPRLKYSERTPEEMAKFTQLVKNAIGYDEARGDQVAVVNVQFEGKMQDYRPKDAWEIFSNKVERYLAPFMPLLKYVIVAVIIFVFYKKIVAPFAERMLEVQEEEDDDIESLMQIDDDEDDLGKFSELRKKVEEQLGLSSGFDEDSIKYEVLLEKMRNVISERPQEIGALFQTLIKDELEITEGIGPKH